MSRISNNIMKNIIIVMIGVLMLASLMQPVWASEADFYLMDASPKQAAPGETTVLTLVLKNLGTKYAQKIEASLDPDDTSPIDPIGSTKLQIGEAEKARQTESFGTVEQLEEITLSYIINVQPTATEKVYQVPLVLSWTGSDGNLKSQTLFVGIETKKREAEFYSIDVTPNQVRPGESTVLEVVLKNLGKTYAANLEADLDSGDISPIDPVGATKIEIEEDRIEPGEDIKIEYPVIVKSTASEKVYYVPLVLTWEDGTGISNSVTLQLGVEVKKDEAEFIVSGVSPDEIVPDVTTQLEIRIRNSGTNYASKIKATLDPVDSSPVDVLGPSRLEVVNSEVGPGDEIVIDYPVYVKSGQDEDIYNTPLRLEWEDRSGVVQTYDLDIGLQIKGDALLRVAKVTTNPVELKPDTEKGEVIITVENAGKTTAKSARIEVGLSEPFTESYSSSSSDFVAEIAPDTSYDFRVSLDVVDDAQAGAYEIPLKLSYRTADRSYENIDGISLRVNSEAEFEVLDAKSDLDLITPGDSFIVNIPIKNKGQERAESVKALIKTKSFFTGVKSDYLGDMRQGDEKVATFELEVDRDTLPDNYNNDITVIWKEGDDRYEEVYSFAFRVSEKPNGNGSGAKGGLAVMLVSVAGIVIWRKKH